MRVLIDPGHAGSRYNKGVVSGYYESNMTWELAGYLKAALENKGIEAALTRQNKDNDPGVYERGRMAAGFDLFVSLHSNACGTESVDRVEVYKPLNGSADDLAATLADVVAKTMNVREGRTATREYPNRPGVDYYGVIRGAVSVGVPGLLIEHSFHTNKAACAFLMQSDNLKALANVEAAAIAEHYGVSGSTSTPSNPGTLYRVQVGAFTVKQNAENCLERAKAAGFTDAFIVTVNK